MDNLARNAMLAKQAGMSYGQWKSLQPPDKIEKKIPEGWVVCKWCGKHFKPRTNQKYCDIDCRVYAYNAKIRKEKQDGKAENVRGE